MFKLEDPIKNNNDVFSDIHSAQKDLMEKIYKEINIVQNQIFIDILNLFDINVFDDYGNIKKDIQNKFIVQNIQKAPMYDSLDLNEMVSSTTVVSYDGNVVVSFDVGVKVTNIQWSEYAIEEADRKVLQGKQNNYFFLKPRNS